MFEQGDKLINCDGEVSIVIKVTEIFVHYITEELETGRFRIDDKAIIDNCEIIHANYGEETDPF
jgi:hypothetical protein